jgi:guanyl-specific ribonuclease Sa
VTSGPARLRGAVALLALIAFVAVALVLGAGLTNPAASPEPGTPAWAESPAAVAPSGPAHLASVPQKVYDVLEAIDRTGAAPDGYRGGTQFMNDGRGGGQVLPRRDASGRSITYLEWDVNPYTGANRGTERLVTGSDRSAWYTDDHYDTFVRIR